MAILVIINDKSGWKKTPQTRWLRVITSPLYLAKIITNARPWLSKQSNLAAVQPARCTKEIQRVSDRNPQFTPSRSWTSLLLLHTQSSSRDHCVLLHTYKSKMHTYTLRDEGGAVCVYVHSGRRHLGNLVGRLLFLSQIHFVPRHKCLAFWKEPRHHDTQGGVNSLGLFCLAVPHSANQSWHQGVTLEI